MAYEAATVDGTGATTIPVAVDVVGGSDIQVVKLDVGGDGLSVPVVGALPVSLASAPLPTGSATSAAQTTQSGYLATLAGAVTASKVQVDIISGSGSGTEYTEGNTDSTITGKAFLWEDTADTLRSVSAAKPLPVQVIAGAYQTTQPVSGTVAISADVPGTGATNLGKAIDSAYGTTDTGVGNLFVRQSVLTALTPVDGDWVQGKADGYGAQWIQMAGAIDATIDSIHSMPVPGVAGAISKNARYTTAQTGTALWTPTSGKKIIVTGLQLGTGGTTAGVVTVWFGAVAGPDITFTSGTDTAVFDGEFAPSTTSRPGAVMSGIFRVGSTDYALRVTTSTAMTLYIVVNGFEI